jgi:hypothetical protein
LFTRKEFKDKNMATVTATATSKKKVISDTTVHEVIDSSPTTLVRLDLRTIVVNLEGTSPFIMHAWSAKAIEMMQAKQAGRATKGREIRKPLEEYEGAFYRLPDGSPAFPALAFKACAVTACTSLGKAITKVAARQFFHIVLDKDYGDLTRIYYPDDCPPVMRTDMVRVGMGVADIRYRPEFKQWGVKLKVQYNARAVSQEQVVNLLNLGGFAVGVGEHRPEKDGDKGTFQVVDKFSWE